MLILCNAKAAWVFNWVCNWFNGCYIWCVIVHVNVYNHLICISYSYVDISVTAKEDSSVGTKEDHVSQPGIVYILCSMALACTTCQIHVNRL